MSASYRSTQKIVFPLYSHPVWAFSLFFIVVILVFITQYFQDELYDFFAPSIGAFSILSLVTPLVGAYLFKTFLSLQDTVSTLTEVNQQEWFTKQKMFIFGINRWSVLTAILLIIGGEITNYSLVGGAWTGFAKFLYFLHVAVLFGALGILGWAYFGILLFSYRLKNLDLDLEPFETKKDEFEKINSSLFGMFLAGVLLYIGAIVASWLSPLNSYILEMFMLQNWIFPLAIIIIAFFVAIQYFLHAVMKKAKKVRLNKILLLIRKHYQEWEKSQSPNHSASINDLLLWKEKIEKETDFPFDFLTITSVIVTVLLPTAKTIIELL